MSRLVWVAVTAVLFGSLSAGALAQERNLSLSPVQSAAQERRVALVIGNSQYKISPLRNPVNDARAIAKALTSAGFNVSLIENAGKTLMRRAIRDFGEALKKGGVGLFYFAGHGIQVADKNFLVPVTAQIEGADDIEDETIDADLIMRQMETAQNQLNIVILDACRNNPFPRGTRAAARGLAEMRAPTGTLVAFATAPGSVAADGTGSNGVYTKHLVDALVKPGLTVEQVFKEVRVNVTKETRNAQVPWESSSLTGEFYFKQQVIAAVPTQPSVDQQALLAAIRQNEERSRAGMEEAIRAALEKQAQQFAAQQKQSGNTDRIRAETTFWESIKSSTDIRDLNAYLERYPEGIFAALAKNRIASMARPVQSPGAATRPNKSSVSPAVAPPVQVAAVQSSVQESTGKSQALPDIGDTWTYALVDIHFKPNDRSRQYTHTIKAVSGAAIMESIRQRGGRDDEEFVHSEEKAGVYRGGFLVEVMPFAHAWGQLVPNESWGKMKIYGVDNLAVSGDYPLFIEKVAVAGAERVAVPAGSFDAIKVRVEGSAANTWTGGQTSHRGYNKYSQIIWYAPAVKRAVKTLVEGYGFTEAYELQSYRVRTPGPEIPAEFGKFQSMRVVEKKEMQKVIFETKEAPKVGDTWTYALVDVRYKPSDRSRVFTHSIKEVTGSSIVELVRRRGLRDEEEFTYSEEKAGVYRGGFLIEVMPFAHAWGQLEQGLSWERVEVHGMENLAIAGDTPVFIERGNVVGTERIIVPAGSFDAIKVRIQGSAANTWTGGQTSHRGYNKYSQTIWYAPAVKRAVKTLVEGPGFTEAYELQSYKVQ